ncbi:MAG: BMC domain-containing protein [Clostridia bacterium]
MKGAHFALGMIETWGFPALIAAADAAAKAADVKVVTYQGADAGIVTIYMIGDVASVQAAVDAGAQAADQVGKLLHSHVIARPDASVPPMIGKMAERESPEAKQTVRQRKLSEQSVSLAAANKDDPIVEEGIEAGLAAPLSYVSELSKKPVSALRKLARSLSAFPLSGAEISRARKDELLQHLKGRERELKRGDEQS